MARVAIQSPDSKSLILLGPLLSRLMSQPNMNQVNTDGNPCASLRPDTTHLFLKPVSHPSQPTCQQIRKDRIEERQKNFISSPSHTPHAVMQNELAKPLYSDRFQNFQKGEALALHERILAIRAEMKIWIVDFKGYKRRSTVCFRGKEIFFFVLRGEF